MANVIDLPIPVETLTGVVDQIMEKKGLRSRRVSGW